MTVRQGAHRRPSNGDWAKRLRQSARADTIPPQRYRFGEDVRVQQVP